MDIKGIPVVVHKWLAPDTAYFIDFGPLDPRTQVITDKVETVRKALTEWQKKIEDMRLRSYALQNLKGVDL